jgi:hypothetical protein
MRRLLFRWSLRSAVVAVAIVGCVLGYVANVRRYRAAQERAIAEIDRLGGNIGARVGSCIVHPDQRPVRAITWTSDEVVDDDLARLAWLPDLDTLYLSAPRVTEAGLERLRVLTNLEDLDLAETPVTEASLGPILRLTRLESLTLRGPITDRGLERLASLKNLRDLCLFGSRVTDAGLIHLERLPHLERLVLPDAGITDAGLGRLARLKTLRELDLTGNPITNACLDLLGAIPGLETAWIDRTLRFGPRVEGFRRDHPGLSIIQE